MSDELNKICVNQTRNGFDKKEIEAKLDDIDKYISKNKVIEKARIDGSEDVKKIIDLVNQEVSSRLKDIELNIEESDRVGFDSIEKDFKKNKTNTMQKELDEFERKTIQTKTVDERVQDADEVIKNRTERIERAKKYDELVKEIQKKDATKTESDIQTQLLDEAEKASGKLNLIDKNEKKVGKIKEPNAYKEIISKMANHLQNSKHDSRYLNKKILNEIKNNIDELRNLTGNTEVRRMLVDIESSIKRDKTKTGVETIEIQDVDKFISALTDDKIEELDWQDAISETKEYYNEKAKESVEEMLEYDLFKLYPDKVKVWKEGLKTGLNISDIISEISAIGKNEVVLKKQVKKLSTDLSDMEKLKVDKLSAQHRKSKLNDMVRRQSTTTAKLFGQDFELENDDGSQVDFSKVTEDNRKVTIEKIYDKVRENEDLREELDRRYELMPVAYREPNIISRAWYRIKRFFTTGEGGKTLFDQRKEDWVKSKIAEQIDDIKKDASGEKSWTLTPEQEIEFNKRQEKVVEKAKKKAREDMVKKGKNAKNANKEAKEEYKKLQREDDEDFIL